jgi:hypothetical protein
MGNIVDYQLRLRQQIPEVLGNVDYQETKRILQRVSELIETANLDETIINRRLDEYEEMKRTECECNGEEFQGLSDKDLERIQQNSRKALRCTIGRQLFSESYREFSFHIADSPLLQQFCEIDTLEPIRVPAKSSLQRYENMVPEKVIRDIVAQVVTEAGGLGNSEALGLEEAIDLEEYFADSTCIEANIHFPVDWVLLRDATRTLMKAVILIRKQGLKHRMQPPEDFIKQMNRLCIEMTHARKRSETKKTRKKILRLMKQLMKKIRKHARNHREVLQERWMETELTEKQVAQVVKRLDGVLEKLPQAIRQAHERIIGERLIANKEKLLSLYEEDVHVIVRGKAGARVEFGNTLLTVEQSQGVIVDWKLYREDAPSDGKALKESLERTRAQYNGAEPRVVVTDRGFESEHVGAYLRRRGIEDGRCPRSAEKMRVCMEDERFREYQKRRGQTEGRIGILKNVFVGDPLRSKGFKSRELGVAWAVLAHNLWVLARLPQAELESAAS